MSWQACAWADGLSYDVASPLGFRVLIKLANVAGADGSCAFRSKSEMASELGVSQRSIQRALRELEMQHLLLDGDQRFVWHLRADRRPKVYDLNFRYAIEYSLPELDGFDGETELSTGDHGETPQGLTGRQLLSHKERSLNKLKQVNKADHSTRAGDNAERSAPVPLAALAASADIYAWCPYSPTKLHDVSHSGDELKCGWCGIQTERVYFRRGSTDLLDKPQVSA